MNIKLALITTQIVLVSTLAQAQAEETSVIEQLTAPAYGLWSIAATGKVSPFHFVDKQFKVTPLVFGGFGPIFIEANRFGYNFYRDGTYFSSIIGNMRNHSSLSKEEIESSTRLKRYQLKPREAALEAGIQLGRRFNNGWIGRIALLQDISTTHKGQEAELSFYRRENFKPFQNLNGIRLLSTFGLQYQSQQLSDYYFGIDDSELNNNQQQAYQIHSAWSAELEFIATYDFSWQQGPKDWALYAGLRHYQFGDTVKDSPIVDSGLTQQYFIGLGHYF